MKSIYQEHKQREASYIEVDNHTYTKRKFRLFFSGKKKVHISVEASIQVSDFFRKDFRNMIKSYNKKEPGATSPVLLSKHGND